MRRDSSGGTVAAHHVFPKTYDRNKNCVSGASFVVSPRNFHNPVGKLKPKGKYRKRKD